MKYILATPTGIRVSGNSGDNEWEPGSGHYPILDKSLTSQQSQSKPIKVKSSVNLTNDLAFGPE